jgi:hypothetical protein
MRVELEPLHMSALRWKDSPSSADIPEHTTIKNRSKRTRGCPPYVFSGIRGVTGGERPEVFDVLSPRNRVGINKEALNGDKKSPMGAERRGYRFREMKFNKYILPNRKFPNSNASLAIRGPHPEAP